MTFSTGLVIVQGRRGIRLWWSLRRDRTEGQKIKSLRLQQSQALRGRVSRRKAVTAVFKDQALKACLASLSSVRIKSGTLSCHRKISLRFSIKADTRNRIRWKVINREALEQGVERARKTTINKIEILDLIVLWLMELVPNHVPEMTAQPGRRATGQVPMPLYNGRITSRLPDQCLIKERKILRKAHPNSISNK